MKKSYKMKEHLKKLSYTAATVVLTVSVIVSMITYMYRFSEQESFEMLQLETQQIKNNINHQMFSDREILRTMASFASKLYSGGEDYGLIFNSFKETGMFENIGILTPDNRFITKLGSLNLEGKVSFEEEKERGEYISGRVKDITNDSREVVRSAVPVKTEDGTVIAVIYGVINLEKLEERYRAEAEAADAQLYVLEGGNGNYIIDTRHNKLGNVTGLSSSRYKKGFSYEKMIDDLTAGVPGYAAFMSQNGEGYLYAHYAPMEFADWQIMLTQSEELVFAGAKATGQYLTLIAGIIILIMLAYITLILASERKAATMNLCASEIRKNLLEVNRSIDKIQDALKSITDFAKSRSAFIIDTYNDDYNYIAPSQKHKLLMGEERSYFNTKLLTYAAKHRTEHGAALYLSEIVTGRKLQSKMPDLYEFARAHDIKRVCYAVVITNNSNTYVLGVINPKAGYVSELLKEIAICFSMAIYNKKHLTKTEAMALTDSLTGTANRMAYKRDVRLMNLNSPDSFACIYIDVNELHYFNDKYGHAAGDQMLVFIAGELKLRFSGSRIYRMGGDEFLIFTEDLPAVVEEKLSEATVRIEEMKYHVAIGVKYRDYNMTVEETVNAAEKLMYGEKAKYYQNKEMKKTSKITSRTMTKAFTGVKEIDACLTVMSRRYLGIYCVSHKDDSTICVLAPDYFSAILEENGSFSASMKKYIHDIAKTEFHRTLISFLEYDVLESQFKTGNVPKTSYTKIDGEKVTLTIHPVSEEDMEGIDSIWIFEKEETEDK